MTKLLAVILAIALTACATGELAQHLEEGMSKDRPFPYSASPTVSNAVAPASPRPPTPAAVYFKSYVCSAQNLLPRTVILEKLSRDSDCVKRWFSDQMKENK